MFKSVFTKYIVTFMLIILISFTLLAGIITSMMVDYSTDTKSDTLERAINAVQSVITERYSISSATDLNAFIRGGALWREISMISRYEDELLFIIADGNGTVLMADDRIQGVIGKSLPQAIVEKTKESGFKQRDTLGGIFSTSYIVDGIAIKSSSGEAMCMVYACYSDSSLNNLIQIMINTIITASLWVLLAALIAIYFISERTIGPLKSMNKAARSFASGKFDVRVPVVGHDEVAELAIAFNSMADSLAQLEEMRRTFLANVSHDLRTPMTTISGFIEGILDGTIPPEKHEYYLNVIASEVRRLSRLVYTLLDISRIEAGERKFNKTVFDICEMARQILISFEQKIDAKHLDVEFNADDEHMYVYADHDAIYQILYNICDNGVKFSKEGGKYKIGIISRDKKVFVSVYNEGQGIAKEELPLVFDRFYKSDKSRSLDKTGVGLGLYIAKTIMDAHNEEIWVKSTYGEYCEFVFTLSQAHEIQIKKLHNKD